jgi:hypothetical protein
MEYVYHKDAGEISGFGGGYEEDCRNMVIAGMKWLETHPDAKLSYKEFKNVYGLTTDQSPDLEEMQKVINEAIGNEATGAMMQACTGHIMAAKKMGWGAYMEKMVEKEKENVD